MHFNSNTAITLHHLALLCTKHCSLGKNALSICLPLHAFQIEGYLAAAGLDVDAAVMVCMSRQDDRWTMGGYQQGGQVVSNMPFT